MIWSIVAGIVVFLLVFFGVYGFMAGKKILAALCFGVLAGSVAGIIAAVAESLSFWF